jgi:hypothetical protein
MQNAFVASVRSGALLADGAHAAITFEIGQEPLTLALPAEELTGLLTVCLGLSAQAAAQRDGEAVQVLPVTDWEVGRTAAQAVVIRFSSEDGASLTYRLPQAQAQELRNALTLATAAPPKEAPLPSPAPEQRTPDLAELVALRERCGERPAAVQLIDRCLALVAELDAANDEGRAVYQQNLLELVSAASEHLKSIEARAADGP